MLRRLTLIAVAWLALSMPAWAAKEDNVCVQTYLIETNFLAGSADGALGPKSVGAATAFLERTGLSDRLPPLSNDTAAEWCAFITSDEGKEIGELAALTLWDVFIDDLPDDGTGPLRFDFAKYELTDRYDGTVCSYVMRANFHEGFSYSFVEGKLAFAEGGHVTFTDSVWRVPMATPETLDRANIAITEKAQLVGKMPVFFHNPPEGAIPPPETIVTLDAQNSALSSAEVPQGKVAFDLDQHAKGEMELRCQGADGPVKIAFDFSPYKLATTYWGYSCAATIMNIYGPDHTDPSGRASFKIDGNGKITFNTGRWMTDGPLDSFKIANLAITRDRRLVGVMDVYYIFRDDENPNPAPITKEFDGSEGQFGEDLRGYAEFKPNPSPTLVQFQINSCRAPAPG